MANLVPKVNNVGTLGSSSKLWNEVHQTKSVYGTSSITEESNVLKVKDAPLTIEQGLTVAGSSSLANATLTGQLSLSSQRIVNVGAPSASSDAATKAYVDSVLQGLDVKSSVRAATTGPVTLATDLENGDTLDTSVTLATGDRILVKDQSTASENGIYIVAASGAPTRADDLSASDAAAGIFVFVEEGTVNADKGFVCTSNTGSDVVGTDSLDFSQFSGAGEIIAGDGLTKTGNTLDVSASGITNAMLAGSIENAKLNTISDANKVSLTSLDLDGGTDIGADLVDSDLFIVDDGAAGTNRKSALTRLKKYIFSSVSGDASATDTGTFTVAGGGSVAASDITTASTNVNIETSSGSLIINNSGSGAFTLKHTNTGSSPIDVLNFNRNQNGRAEFYAPITTCVGQTGTNILGGTNTEISGNLYPGTNNGRTLGSASNTWSDLYLGDGSILYFGNDQEIRLEHDADDGLILKMSGASINDPSFTLLSDYTGSSSANITFKADSASPAANDIIGSVTFKGNVTGASGANNIYANINCRILDPAAGSNLDVGRLHLYAIPGFNAGLQIDGISGDSFKSKVNILAHNGVDSGLFLDGDIVTSSATELNALDVSVESPADNDVLTYTTANGLHWAAAAGGGGGGSVPTITSASPSSTYTISTTSGIEEVFLLTPSVDITVNLPAAATAGSGYKYQIKNLSANTITVDPSGSETIDGAATFALSSQYSSITAICDGSNWFII